MKQELTDFSMALNEAFEIEEIKLTHWYFAVLAWFMPKPKFTL